MEQKEREQKQTCIIVLGMHRSGTSVLSGILNILGVDLGKKLIAPNEYNPKGFFEHADIVSENINIFEQLGVDRKGWRTELVEGWTKKSAIDLFKQKIKNIIKRDFSESRLFGLKDPRISILLPVYIDILNELNIKIIFAIIERPEIEIALSVKERSKLSLNQAIKATRYFKRNIDFYTKNKEKFIVNFNDLIDDPIYTIEKMIKDSNLPIKLDDNNLSKIKDFIDPKLKHHNLNNNNDLIFNLIAKFEDENKDLILKLEKENKQNEALLRIVDEKNLQINELNTSINYFERNLVWRILKIFNMFVLSIFPRGSFVNDLQEKIFKMSDKFLNEWLPEKFFKKLKKDEKKIYTNHFWTKFNDKHKDIDILFITHDESRTGAPRILFDIAEYISKEKKVAIVALKRGSMEKDFEDTFGPVIHSNYLYPFHGEEKKIKEILERTKPKVVYANSIGTYRYAEIAKKLGIKVIFHVHELDIAFRIVLNSKQKKRFKNFADKFIAVSQPVYDLLINKMKCNPEKVELINEFVDREKIIRLSKETQIDFIKNELGIKDNNEIVIMAMGSFIYRKGADMFMKIAEHFKDSGYRCRFVWIGGRPFIEPFMADFNKHKEHFLFLGEKKNPFPYLASADILICPSREDPFPLVVLESMALGKPVVVFREAGGISDAVKDAGEIVNQMNVDDFIESLEKLILYKDLRNELGQKSMINQLYYDSSKILPKIKKSIDSIFENKLLNSNLLSFINNKKMIKSTENFPIFILGSVRSGTSIVTQAIKRGAGIQGYVEGRFIHLLSLYLRKTDEVFNHTNFFLKQKLDPRIMLAVIDHDKFKEDLVDWFLEQYKKYSKFDGQWVDKSPNTIYGFENVLTKWPNTKFIIMKRRPIENIESRLRKFPNITFENHCLSLKEIILDLFEIKKKIPCNVFIEIDQYDVATKSDEVADEIGKFLNFSKEQIKKISEIFKTSRPEHTGGDETVIKSLDQTDWTDEQKKFFKETLGELSERSGYSLGNKYYL